MSQYTKKDLPEPKDPAANVQLHVFGSSLMQGDMSMLIKGLRGTGMCNSWRTLVEHEPSGTKLWFDVGVSDDLSEYTDSVRARQHKMFRAKPAANNILDDLKLVKVDPVAIKYVLLSHAHWDHVFPVGKYFPNAKYICGPGTLQWTSKTWPEFPDSDFDARIWNPDKSELPIEELPDPSKRPDKWQRIGPFEHGYDFFGDGSFWVVDAPGHCPGNLLALARTSNRDGERKWVLLGGDCLHGYHLLHYPNAPFGELSLCKSGVIHEEPDEARKTIQNISAVKRAYGDELFVWPAHADSLEGIWEFDL